MGERGITRSKNKNLFNSRSFYIKGKIEPPTKPPEAFLTLQDLNGYIHGLNDLPSPNFHNGIIPFASDEEMAIAPYSDT